MSSRIVITTKRFCTKSIDNLCTAMDLLGYSYQKTENAILMDKCRIEIADTIAYMRISERNREALQIFDSVNNKLAEIEAQLRIQGIEKNRLEQERAKQEAETYRVRQLKREEERLDYEKKQLVLERQSFVDAKKKAIIAKARDMGYSVEERVENGTVKLKLIKRLY
ncbi:MAG: hypothetical protein K2N30_05525 [Clostridia bacterium]|nr:hypothetical protein [Clostridia bacterium]